MKHTALRTFPAWFEQVLWLYRYILNFDASKVKILRSEDTFSKLTGSCPNHELVTGLTFIRLFYSQWRLITHIYIVHTEVNYNSQKAKTVKTNVFVNRRAIRYITQILISDIITSLQKGLVENAECGVTESRSPGVPECRSVKLWDCKI